MIKTGIASFGMSGKVFHAPFIDNHPQFELSAIVERNNNDSREKYGNSKLYRSFEEMIADESLVLIVVNTPAPLHYDFAKQALAAGKNVIVEKPFTIDAKEAIALDKLAKEKELLLTVYQNRRYDGDFAAVKNIISSGLLGKVKEVEIKFDRYRPTPGNSAHKDGQVPGAGVLHNLGPHTIDQVIELFDMPQAIYADVRILRDGAQVNDYFEILCYYEGFVVRIKSSMLVLEATPAYIIHGTKGSFFQHRTDLQETNLVAGAIPSLAPWCPPPASPDGFLYVAENGVTAKTEQTSVPGNYMLFYDDVYKALTGLAPNPVPATDAIKTMTIIDAAFESDRTGKRIVL